MAPLVPIGIRGANGLPLREMRIRALPTLATASLMGALFLGITPGSSEGGTTPGGTTSGPWGISVADVNGDSMKDIIVATGGGNTVRLLVNNLKAAADAGSDPLEKRWSMDKTKPFMIPGVPADGGNTPTDIATADLNGDGTLEVLVPRAGDDKITTLSLDPSTGNFTPYSVTEVKGSERSFLTGAAPINIGTGFLNGDKCLDAATVNTASRDFGVFLGLGPGYDSMDPKPASSFRAQVSPFPQAFQIPNGLVVADFNGDKKIDMASANSGDRTLSIQINQGWSTAPLDAKGNWKWPAVKKGAPPLERVVFNDSAKRLLASYIYDAVAQRYVLESSSTTSGCGKDPTMPIDWNLDYDGGRPKAPINPATVGQPTFKPIIQGAGFAPIDIAPGDFNGDGKMDMVTGSTLDGGVYVMMSTPGKKFKPGFKASAPMDIGNCDTGKRMPQFFATGDWDGDKKTDIAISSPACRDVVILKNLGKGKWSIPYKITIPDGASPSAIKLADLNGDSKDDLIINDDEAEALLIAISKGVSVPKSPVGATFDMIETGDLLNPGPSLITEPVLTDGTTDCGTPAAVPACRPIVGDEISTNDGTWAGADDAAAAGFDYTYTYTWERKTASGTWATIPGQTANTYTLAAGDVNYLVRACVTAYSGQAGARVPSDLPACTPATRATRAS